MKKIRDIKRLKIVEQIILVLLLAVITPTIVSTFIVNNINQHAVRNELQYSALSISESIASNIETFTRSGEDELDQIVLALRHIPDKKSKSEYLKELFTNSKLISELQIINKDDKDKYISWDEYSIFNEQKNEIQILKKIDEDTAILATVDIQTFKDQIFNIYKKDDRQIYILGQNNTLLAAHKYNKKDFDRLIYALPKNLISNKDGLLERAVVSDTFQL